MEQPRIVRIRQLSDQGNETDLLDTTPEERVGMMWQLAQGVDFLSTGDPKDLADVAWLETER